MKTKEMDTNSTNRGKSTSKQAHLVLRLNLLVLLTGFLPISAAAYIYLVIPPYAIGPIPSLSGQAITYRWRSLPRVRRHVNLKVVPNEFAALAGHHGPINMRPSFPHPLLV